MTDLLRLRLAKLRFSFTHASCWRALSKGVTPSLEHEKVLKPLDCDLLLDVGANRGQFSLMTRALHPQWPIQAYEPQPEEAAVYRHILGGHKGIRLHQVALGEQPGTAELHISRRADSSSLLPIGELQARMFPSTEEVGTRLVEVLTLDSLPGHWQTAQRALLKLDVQGFELGVLQGARLALKHCAYVYAECSEVQLYTGQALYPEIRTFLKAEGFEVVRRANEQQVDARLIQADYLFGRS